MVRGVNKVILLGNTAAEPEFRVLPNGSTSIASVGLATNESYRDQNGNLQEQTEWHRLVFWNRLAEIARDFCHKGSQIYVEGQIKTRSYDDQQGIKRYSTEIHVTELHLLSQKSAGNGASETAVEAAQAYPQGGYPQAPAYQQQGYPQQPAPQAYAQQQSQAQPQSAYPQQTPVQPPYGGYQPQPAPAFQQQGYRQQRPQGSFRNAPPAGAVPVVDAPAQPAAAPAQAPTPAAFQQPDAAAPAGAARPFKDDDLPF